MDGCIMPFPTARATNSPIAERKKDLPCLDMVRQAIAIFADPAHNVFLTAMPSKKAHCFSPTAIDHIASFVEDATAGRSTYFGINPVGQVEGHAKDADVVRRRWLFIDIDRNKTLQPNDPSTDQEHEDAKKLASEIAAYLGEIGFPVPILCDSGNGWHLYYRIDLPNDNDSKVLIRTILALLDSTFSNIHGDVGAECYDARRLSRIPGTWSRRGERSADRPYRMCQLINVPSVVEIVPVELLKKLIEDDSTTTVPVPTTANMFSSGLKATNGTDEDARKKLYAKKAIDAECLRVAMAATGERNNQLFKSSAALFNLVAGGVADPAEVQDRLYEAAKLCGLESVEICPTVESGRRAGLQTPRGMPENNGKHSAPAATAKLPEKIIILASDITPRKIQWLWDGRIPLDSMTTFAGSTGLGKTTVLTDIVSRVTTGAAWPDGSNGNSPGKVLYISGEDAPDTTLVPRLIAAGGDRSRVAYFKPEVLGTFTLERIDLLDMALNQLGNGCQLVCIDPPTSFLAGTDDHKNAELRQLLTPLGEWASLRRVAIVFITHINKGGANTEAVMRIIGSVAWANAVRAAHMFSADPDDETKAIFIGVKVNGAKKKKGLSYRVVESDDKSVDWSSRINWLGEIDTTANDAMKGQSKVGRRGKDAAEWLIKKFREKLEWESAELRRAGEENGISKNALYEAKKTLNISARTATNVNGDSTWYWYVQYGWKGFESASVSDSGNPGNAENKETQADVF